MTQKEIEAFRAKMNKTYGEGALVRADEVEDYRISYFSTGVYALDCALGGGIPRNRITEISGLYSSLKTTLLQAIIREFQRTDPAGQAHFFDIEHTWDPRYTKVMQVDHQRLFVWNPATGEECVDMVCDTLNLDVPLLIGLDSVGALMPSKELETNADDKTPALRAKIVNRLVGRLTMRMRRSYYDQNSLTTTVVALNQLRQKFVMFGSPWVTPGGVGKDFHYGVTIRLKSSRSDALFRDVTRQGVTRQVRYGQKVEYSVDKNKCGGSQFEEGEFEYYIRPTEQYPAFSFNNDEALWHFGLFFGAIQTRQGTFSYGPISAKKSEAFKQRLAKAAPYLKQQLYQEILSKINEDYYAHLLVAKPTRRVVVKT